MVEQPKIIGIGAAILDSIAHTDANLLNEFAIRKNGMTLVDYETQNKISNNVKFIKRQSGGSVSNTLCTLARLGNNTAMNATFCDDESGILYQQFLKSYGVTLPPAISSSTMNTSHAMILVTDDGERSMAVNIDASSAINYQSINESWFKHAKLLLIEGYMWCADETAKLAETLIAEKSASTKLAITSPDSYHCSILRDRLVKSMSQADVLFTNKDEFIALQNAENLDGAIAKGKIAKHTIITRDIEGCTLLDSNSNATSYSADPVLSPLDSTGAGDAFAAGFLHYFCDNEDITKGIELGTKLARQVIMVEGAHAESIQL